MNALSDEIDRLRRIYPAFVIVPTQVYDGQRIAAYRQDLAACGGLYAVIGTPDEVEEELAKAVGDLEASLGS
jgi:alkanesulfonate monooxygenase SsuD/methylene tetrahydromethanopterin reductase-like flavin-dependent oxidoreductase (luciferase family)